MPAFGAMSPPVVEGNHSIIAGLVVRFVDALVVHRGASLATVRSYGTELTAFGAHLAARGIPDDPRAVTRDIVVGYVGRPLADGRTPAPATRNKRLSVVASFFRYLTNEGVIAASPVIRIGWARVPLVEPALPTSDDVLRLIALVRRSRRGVFGVRDAAILSILYLTGLRVSELVALVVPDVTLDLARPAVRLRRKGGRVTTLPISRSAAVALAEWLALRPAVADPTCDAVFVGRHGHGLTTRAVQEIVAKWGRVGGLPRRLHPHLLRHLHCSETQRRGAPIKAVAELMGHASLKTTSRYSHADEPMLRAAAATLDDAAFLGPLDPTQFRPREEAQA